MELFSPGHLVPLLIVVAILFFGWKQLPDMSRSLGRSLRIFRTELKGMNEDDAARTAAKEAAASGGTPVVGPTAVPPGSVPPAAPVNPVVEHPERRSA